jgi:gluconolactonase
MNRAPAQLVSLVSLAAVAALPAGCATSPTPPAGAVAAAPLLPGAGPAEAVPGGPAFVSLEGPHWVATGSGGGHLLFSDVAEANAPEAHIYRLDPGAGTFSVLPYPAAGPTSTNGLAVDPTGRLLACERYNGRLVRVETDGKATVLAERWPAGSDTPLGAPNDLAVRSDGNIYFTDSDWGVRPGAHAAMGVYRVAPDGQLSRVLDLDKPNGIALSPDGRTLYVGSDVQAKVWKLPVDQDGKPGAASLLIDGASVPGGFKVPDGICVDDGGNLHVTNNDDAIKAIVVFDPSGRQLGRIAIPFRPSNCTFGGEDRRTMYVTTLHAIYRVRMPTPGLP